MNKRLSPKETHEKMIQDVLDNFDFKRCRRAMIALNWTWTPNPTSPSIEELKISAHNRLRNAIDGILNRKNHNHNQPYYVSSGGLKATAYINKFKQIVFVQLEFVLTEWESDGDS